MKIENNTLIFEEGDFNWLPDLWEHDVEGLDMNAGKWLMSEPSWDNEYVMNATSDTELLIALKDEYLARAAAIDILLNGGKLDDDNSEELWNRR